MAPDLEAIRDPLGLQRLGYAQPMLAHPAVRWEHETGVEREEQVAEEVPVVLAYNGRRMSS